MLESTPGSPYDGSVASLLSVEGNMRLRYVYIFDKNLPILRCPNRLTIKRVVSRRIARHHLSSHEIPMTLTSWPRLGVADTPFSDPHSDVQGEAMQSLFVGDQLINEHIRFP